MKEIATYAQCSIGVVSKVLRLYLEYGEVKDPFFSGYAPGGYKMS